MYKTQMCCADLVVCVMNVNEVRSSHSAAVRCLHVSCGLCSSDRLYAISTEQNHILGLTFQLFHRKLKSVCCNYRSFKCQTH